MDANLKALTARVEMLEVAINLLAQVHPHSDLFKGAIEAIAKKVEVTHGTEGTESLLDKMESIKSSPIDG